jgi:hypothetical protein
MVSPLQPTLLHLPLVLQVTLLRHLVLLLLHLHAKATRIGCTLVEASLIGDTYGRLCQWAFVTVCDSHYLP